jgi:hypothetical protein
VTRVDAIAIAIAIVLTAASCTRSARDAGSDAAASGSSSATAVPGAAPGAPSTEGTERGSDELKPVYPVDAGPPNPAAQRLCDALYATPARASAACPGAPPAAAAGAIEGQCVRTLTAALASHAVTLADADVAACDAAVSVATAGCGWIKPSGAGPLPPACDGIVRGTLPVGERCRSSLECAGSLRCQGLSTIDVGRCGPPKPAGAACALATDMLAVFARQDSTDRAHPECAGTCRGHRCGG